MNCSAMAMWRLASALLALVLFYGVPAVASAPSWETITQAIEARHLGQARAALEAWLAVHPEDDRAQAALARVLTWRGESEAALALWQDLVRRHPDDADMLLGLAQAQMQRGRWQAALQSLQRVHRLAPDYLDAWRLHLTALRAQGDARAYRRLRRELRRRFPEKEWPPWAPVTTTATLDFEYQSLDPGWDPWRRIALHVTQARAPLHWALAYERSQRFGLWDDLLDLRAGRRLGPWSFTLGAGYGPSSTGVLPDWSLEGGLVRALPRSFSTQVTLRHLRYPVNAVDTLNLALSRHQSAFDGRYDLIFSRLDVGATAAVQRLTLGHSRGRQTWIFTTWGGRELSYEPGPGVLSDTVLGAALRWQHRWRAWRVEARLQWHRQGDRYTRKGVGLGIGKRF